MIGKRNNTSNHSTSPVRGYNLSGFRWLHNNPRGKSSSPIIEEQPSSQQQQDQNEPSAHILIQSVAPKGGSAAQRRAQREAFEDLMHGQNALDVILQES
ncbi:expressed unknown protein [Seminavis robusta]|uniref:Uncharacterized protein n=1 Tax=Seminavis robusta TaxID=568900 RepID=A0A9N8HGL8_9STRA|nr:expressed unknown protein [Seminavis robusta]|eukprot:Sro491_g153680.1 n/a (99) ;mRNA; f:35749-36045